MWARTHAQSFPGRWLSPCPPDSLLQAICTSPERGTPVGVLGLGKAEGPWSFPGGSHLALPRVLPPAHSGCCPRCWGGAWGSGGSRQGRLSREAGQSGKALLGATEPGLRPTEGPLIDPPLGAWGSRLLWVSSFQGRHLSIPGSDVLVHAHTCACRVCMCCVSGHVRCGVQPRVTGRCGHFTTEVCGTSGYGVRGAGLV